MASAASNSAHHAPQRSCCQALLRHQHFTLLISPSLSSLQGGAISVVDNSMLAPMFAQPLSLGADICMTSATKFIGGHSDLTAGILSVKHEELAQRIAFVQVQPELCALLCQAMPPSTTQAVRLHSVYPAWAHHCCGLRRSVRKYAGGCASARATASQLSLQPGMMSRMGPSHWLGLSGLVMPAPGSMCPACICGPVRTSALSLTAFSYKHQGSWLLQYPEP